MRISAVVACFSCVCAAALAQNQQAPLRLRPGDAVRIEIKDEPDLSGEFPIGVDGKVLLPLVGSHTASEQPFEQVERALRAAYAQELVDPVIRVTPLVRVAVLGEVKQPGLLLVDPTFTVADVLAQAGGLAPTANSRKIVITRPGGAVSTRLDLKAARLALHLGSGDQIMVERRGFFGEYGAILVSAAGSLAAVVLTAVLLR